MSVQGMVKAARERVPLIEFRIGADWFQFDPVSGMARWRHHRAPGWSRWAMDPTLPRRASSEALWAREVARAEADDWRARPEPGAAEHLEIPAPLCS